MSAQPDRVAYYRGKAIEDMSREELIEALNQAARMLNQQREEHAGDLNFLTTGRRES